MGVHVNQADLLNQYYVTPWVVVMNFKTRQGKKYPLVVLADRVDGEVLRKMRVYLRQLKAIDIN